MPTGFHPNPSFFSPHLELAVELLRFLAVPQFPFVQFPRVRIDKRNLLEARVIVTTYNDHVRLLSPEPWLVSATKVYSGMGADIVMESFCCWRWQLVFWLECLTFYANVACPVASGAFLFDTICMSVCTLTIASMHNLMHTPYRLRQTCNDLRRLQCLLTTSNH